MNTALKNPPKPLKPKKKRQPQKLPKVLSKPDIETFLSGIDTRPTNGIRDKAILLTMYRAGLRVSEVCDLTPYDVLFADRLITVIDGKGGKDRNVYIDDILLKALKSWDKIRPESEYFYCSYSRKSIGNKLDPRRIRQICEELSDYTGVYLHDKNNEKAVHPHTLRHCHAVDLIEEGYGLHEIKDLLGHTNIQTTSVYLSVRNKELKNKIINRK